MPAPGIEFQSIDADRDAADALRADVPGFAGVFERGPVLVPVRVEDWGQTTRVFGSFFRLRGASGKRALAPLALYGFQQNGGATAVVFRLASPRMCAAVAVLPDPATGRAVGLAASSPGAWANGVRIRIPLRVVRRAQTAAFPLASGLAKGTIVRVRSASGAIAFGTLRNVKGGLELNPPTSLPGPYVLEELDPIVTVHVSGAVGSERFSALSLDPSSDAYVWRALAAPPRLPPEEQPHIPDAWRPVNEQLVLALAQQGAGSASEFVRATRLDVEWSRAGSPLPPWPAPAADALASAGEAALSATLAGGRDEIVSLDAAVFREAIDVLVQHPLPSMLSIPDLMLPVVPRSECTRAVDETRLPTPLPPPAGPCAAPRAGETSLAEDDGAKALSIPPPESIEPDDVPDFSAQIEMLQAELLSAVATRGDSPAERIALLDPLPDCSPSAACQAATALSVDAPRPELGVLFYPWLRVVDPLAPDSGSLLVPPSGHIAGMLATATRTRGPSAPFANLPIAGAVAAERSLNVTDRARLNSGQICAIREIAGRGPLLFGERSLSFESGPAAFVPPMRALAHLRRVVRVAGETLAFEPNDMLLSLRITVTLEAVLRELFLQGAFAGETPAESYGVRCDDVTTTPGDRALGRVIALVDVALAVPLEFLTIRVAFSRDGASVLDAPPSRGDV